MPSLHVQKKPSLHPLILRFYIFLPEEQSHKQWVCSQPSFLVFDLRTLRSMQSWLPTRAELPECLQASGESPWCSFSFSLVVVSVRGRHLCAVVVKAAFLFLVWMWMMFGVCFWQIAFIELRKSPFIPNLLKFAIFYITSTCWTLSNVFLFLKGFFPL